MKVLNKLLSSRVFVKAVPIGIAILILSLVVCGETTKWYVEANTTDISHTPVGTIQSVSRLPRIPGGFGSRPTKAATEVMTDKIAVMFEDHPIVKIGAEAEIIEDSRGMMWFTWEGQDERYRITK